MTIAALERERPLFAGMVLSLTLLKPPQGLPILILAAAWFLARRDWKAFVGLGLGAASLILIGMLGDPLWPLRFAAAGQDVVDRTLGVQSNALSLAYLACAGSVSCMWLLGGGVAIGILALTGLYLWRHGADLRPWQAFNLIIPTA
ncbi:MAG: glycosyltransferase 87 family protein, partial [Chloroflexota bacterium]